MPRNPKCYAFNPDEWIATLRQHGGTIILGVPQAVVRSMHLRPGMMVKIRAEKVKLIEQEEEVEPNDN